LSLPSEINVAKMVAHCPNSIMLKSQQQFDNPVSSAGAKTTAWQKYRHFNLALLATALAPVFLVGLVNYVADPYGVFKTPTRRGFNLLKPVQDDQVRLFKPAEVIYLEPQRVFLGSSRIIRSLDPEHPVFDDNLVTYNLGLTSPNLTEIRELLEHSIRNQTELKQVILSLDFFMFKTPRKPPSRIDNDFLGKTQIPPLEFLRLALSLDTLKASQKTFADNQKSSFTQSYYNLGMRRDSYASDKQSKLDAFAYQIDNYFNNFYKDFQLDPQAFQEVQKILELCKQKNIDLQVIVAPIHATQLQAIEQAGLWTQFMQWKKQLSQMTPYWDFATYNPINNEPINEGMKNFHDSAHCTKEVGDLVLNRIFAYQDTNLPQDFGQLVSADNINNHLTQINLSKDLWVKNNPTERNLVKNIYQNLHKSQKK
jgi:hypothetical protein